MASDQIDSPAKATVRFMGKEIPRSSVETALYSTTAFFVIFNAISIPFALPKLRAFLGAPYLPSSTRSFRAVLDNIPELSQTGLKMVDIGSGDGRLVLEASRRGYKAMGIELNPWLVLGSRLRLATSGSKIIWANAWKSVDALNNFAPDVLTFYGRPGQSVMTKFGHLAEQVSDESGKDMLIVSNKFPIPGWNLRLIAHIEDFYVYKLHSNRE